MKTLQSKVELNNGEKMPIFGLGVFDSGEETVSAVTCALNEGYRLIDTASFYGNEKEVGEGIRNSGIKREDVFVTTKVWNDSQRQGRQRESFEKSLKALNMEYIDLLLIHWPVPIRLHQTWKVLEQLYEEKLVKAIGVSNFLEHHLEQLSVKGNIIPAVDQFECNPYNTKRSLRQYCKEHTIVSEAWSPLGRGAALNDPLIKEMAEKYGKSTAQIILRFDIENDIVTIPKSVKPNRIRENTEIFDFSLTARELKQIEALNRDLMHGNPDCVDF